MICKECKLVLHGADSYCPHCGIDLQKERENYCGLCGLYYCNCIHEDKSEEELGADGVTKFVLQSELIMEKEKSFKINSRIWFYLVAGIIFTIAPLTPPIAWSTLNDGTPAVNRIIYVLWGFIGLSWFCDIWEEGDWEFPSPSTPIRVLLLIFGTLSFAIMWQTSNIIIVFLSKLIWTICSALWINSEESN